MGMSIDEIIKYLPAPICGSTVIDSQKQKEYEAHDTAVIIMRKYQKIEQIVSDFREYQKGITWGFGGEKYMQMVSEVVEDGTN